MAITAISSATKLAIERKTAKTLPDQPTARGYTADTIRGTMYKWLTDTTNSLFAELDRIVTEANTSLSNLEDGTTSIAFDNLESGLTAENMQDALDELDGIVDNIIAGTQNITYNNAVSGLTAETVKAALDEIDGDLDDVIAGTTVVAEATKATNDANDDAIHSTYEKLANKKTALTDNSDTYYPTQKAVKTAVDLKVDKTLTILGIDHQNDITLTEFKTALGNATTELAGLMSATDKSHLEALYALLGAEVDVDEIANTINEILAIFEGYPNGADLVTVLQGKVDKTSIIDNLTTGDTTKVLSAKQGKVLQDTKEELTNKATDFSVLNDTKYPTTKAVKDLLDATVGNINDILDSILGV